MHCACMKVNLYNVMWFTNQRPREWEHDNGEDKVIELIISAGKSERPNVLFWRGASEREGEGACVRSVQCMIHRDIHKCVSVFLINCLACCIHWLRNPL